MKRNVYIVLSEELHSFGWADPPEPPEYYRIVEAVVAEKRSRAKRLAMENDRDTRGLSPSEYPKCQVVAVQKNVRLPEGIYTYSNTVPARRQARWWAQFEHLRRPVEWIS